MKILARKICWYCDGKLHDLHRAYPALPIYMSIVALTISMLAIVLRFK